MNEAFGSSGPKEDNPGLSADSNKFSICGSGSMSLESGRSADEIIC